MAERDGRPLRVEVVYALPERQTLLTLYVAAGTTLAEAVTASAIAAIHPEIDLAATRVGIFGKFSAPDTVLHDGDRVELYRPLVADPKEARRARARKRQD
jgi:putative ubiquitin-RnfH superfamily antitoxin RatB of RatAB toxin-antitoxin module